VAERQFVVCMTGSSGAVYGVRLVDALSMAGAVVHVVLSEPARRVLLYEEGIEDPSPEKLFARPESVVWHGADSVEAAPASGSAGVEAVIVCPCSMGTLGRIAGGYSVGLIGRVADVALKEGRTLILVPRETPLSLIHLENMTRLVRAGAVILPASPGFYHRPKTRDDLIDFVLAKILHRLGVDSALRKPWETPDDLYEDAT
jgi:4-hydroxy-3-polyprenylbenzoate decarboxylase